MDMNEDPQEFVIESPTLSVRYEDLEGEKLLNYVKK